MTLMHSGGMCLKQLFDYDVDIINSWHASKVSFVPLTQENEGNRVSLPIAARPALMPALTVNFWEQTKTAALSTHSYTTLHQEWLFPQQSEADDERTWTLSKTALCIPLDGAFPSFKMREQVCRYPANTLTLAESQRCCTHHTSLDPAVKAPKAAEEDTFCLFSWLFC